MDNLLVSLNMSENDLVTMLQNNGTSAEHKILIKQFYTHLAYDYQDFVVDLNQMAPWLNCNKDRLRAIVLANLLVGDDYLKNEGGIMMTTGGFSKLCSLVRTPRADQISRYYDSMQSILLRFMRAQLKNVRAQLHEKELYRVIQAV